MFLITKVMAKTTQSEEPETLIDTVIYWLCSVDSASSGYENYNQSDLSLLIVEVHLSSDLIYNI